LELHGAQRAFVGKLIMPKSWCLNNSRLRPSVSAIAGLQKAHRNGVLGNGIHAVRVPAAW
jgi:hypothetical protein